MAVGGGVYFDDEQGKEDVHAEAVHPNKTTTMLTLTGTEAVEWVAEGRNVEAVPNQDLPSIDSNDCQSRAQDGGKQIVAHVDRITGNRLVQNECTLVWEHMVCRTRVSNKETTVAEMIHVGDERGEVCQGFLEKCKDKLG